MKKNLPYLLLIVLAVAAAILLLAGRKQKVFDKRVSLNKKYTHPYGTKVLYEMLPNLLPGAKVDVNRKSPEDWFYGNDEEIDSTLFVLVTQHFNPTKTEMLLLNRFVKYGNQLLIVSPEVNEVASGYFNISVQKNQFIDYNNYRDSPSLFLRKPCFAKDTVYTYPGYTFNTHFSNVNDSFFVKVGTTKQGLPNCLKTSVGNGTILLHSDPFAFTNFFILYKNNKEYLEKTFALLNPAVKKVMWDEYYVYKLNDNEKAAEPSPLRVLLSIPAFRWAFILVIAFLALYLLLNVKRKQRFIPDMPFPKNESLEFAKTIGRLYFEKQDHINLAQKMAAYFLEHIRSKYFINTSALNEEFIQKLIGKSGCNEDEIRQLVQSIYDIQISISITQEQLTNYYIQFNNFYKNTN